MGNTKGKLGMGKKAGKALDQTKKTLRVGKQGSGDATEQNVEVLLNKGPIEEYYDVDYNSVLGKGHYAIVNLGVDKRTGLKVAIKRIQISKSRVEALKREVEVLRKVGRHPNIVTLYDIFITETELILVLELLLGGELFDRMVERGPYSEREASHHIRKIGQALKYLHRAGIVHRDLKPENLILTHKGDNSELKIADFGLANIVDNTENATMKTVCGTWAYCAPEVKTSMTEEGGPACYTAKVDLWSVGVILFVILGAYHPFDADGDASDVQLWNNICSGKFDFDDPAWDHISAGAKDLIRKLIVVDAEKRFGTDELLSHPWIRQAGSVPATPITPTINKLLTDYNDRRKSRNPFIGKLKGKQTGTTLSPDPGQTTLGTQQITEMDLIEQRRMLQEQRLAETKQKIQMHHYQQQQQLKQQQQHQHQILLQQHQQLMQINSQRADQQQLAVMQQQMQEQIQQLEVMFHHQQQQLLNQQQVELQQALQQIREEDSPSGEERQRSSVRFADEISIETSSPSFSPNSGGHGRSNNNDESPMNSTVSESPLDSSENLSVVSSRLHQLESNGDEMVDAEDAPPLPKLTLNTLLPSEQDGGSMELETPRVH